ncbi:S41 family peptidase [Aerococcus vaginalis]
MTDVSENEIAEVEKDTPNSERKSIVYKRREGLPTFFWIVLLIVSVLLTFSITNYIATGRLPWEWGHTQNVLTNNDFRDFQRTYRLLSSNYYGEIDDQKLINQGIAGMTEAVDDPYTGFYFDSDSAALQSSINAKFEGIGATVQEKDGKIVVVSPVKDSPAEKAGLKPNDILLSVDGKPLDNVSTEEAVKHIRGKAGTTVKLEIQRSEEIFNVSVKRAEIPIETVHSAIDDNDSEVAVIQITTFSENTADEFKRAVEAMRQSGAKRFVVDLRGNPGGLLASALHIANMFLKDGETIVSVVDKYQNKETYRADDEQYGTFKITEPSVVLVDKGSASASEIIAGALQQSANIPIVGTQTFGKGTVQSVIPYEADESRELKVTTAHWMTPNGEWINEKGITPDHPAMGNDEELWLIDTSQTYQQGDQSKAIENIKKMFATIGRLDSNEVNEQFDESLTAVVRSFQSEQDLEVSGTIDADTAKAIMQAAQKALFANDEQTQQAIEILNASVGGNTNE